MRQSLAFSSSSALPFSVDLMVPTAQDMEDMGGLIFSSIASGSDSKKNVSSSSCVCICLDGDLGAGKTALARGFIRVATGDDNLRVTSPTYLLSNTYRYYYNIDNGKAIDNDDSDSEERLAFNEIHHMDLYRLGPKDDLTPLNLAHVFDDNSNCISLIEWPARLGNLKPKDRLDVYLTILSGCRSGESGKENGYSTFLKHPVEEEDGGGGNSLPRRMRLEPHGVLWTNRIQQLLDEGCLEDLLIPDEG